jgi:hypothetical protein
MAAVSLKPSVEYTIRVSGKPWRPAEVRSVRISAGGVQALSIRLGIDWNQLP